MGKLAYSYINICGIINITIGIAYPGGSFDAPILIFEKIELPRVITFALIDFIPLSKRSEYLRKYIEPMRIIKEDFDYILGNKISGSENFRTPYSFSGFFRRYHKFSVGVALERYLNLWVNLLGEMSVVNSTECKEEIESRRKDFKKKYPFSKNSVRILSFFFGKNLVKGFLNKVFF